MKKWTCVFLALSACFAHAQSVPSPVILEGEITAAQNKTYVEAPFEVPAGVHRISVDFKYTGREQHTAIDLGIEDPFRFRGASGGNKSHFTISETDATPSYLPGVIPAGQWKLLLAVPNIRAGEVSHYHAEIRFNAPAEDQSFTLEPLAVGTRWYRGDLHMHTAHSDGSCASQSGKRVPCPLFLTVQTAAERGLDFIAITDHNADSQYDDMRELQPYFDRTLLIPGREITTFWGHFNEFGVTQFVDYREVAQGGRDVNAIARDVVSKGGIVSINHADAPSGEACMGCGWEPPMPVDMSLFTGIEVINGGERMFSSADLWDKEIGEGHRLTAVGGSDSHNALEKPGPHNSIGWPTTVVEAGELSVPAILDGIRHGRVFIDLTASHDKVIDLDATAGTGRAQMGGNLRAGADTGVKVDVHVAACSGDTVRLLVDGHETAELGPMTIAASDATLHSQWKSDGGRHWLRAEVRDANQTLVLVSNPIYINFPAQ